MVEDVRRDPLAGAELPKINDFPLTHAQSEALAAIAKPLYARRYAAFLLHGITGSGKTEVYLRAMRAALEQGRSALMLVPEIALTPVFFRRLRAVFGDLVAILHSGLTQGERFDEWSRIRRGIVQVVIGTRSAVFAPLEKLGLLVVDEEHEASYRQQDAPFYHARDAAIVRAPKPNIRSVQSCNPSVRPRLGNDSASVAIVSHNRTRATGWRVIASEKSHVPSSANAVPIWASVPRNASSKPSMSIVNHV